MSYKKELEMAKTFDDCQKAYDKECFRKYKYLEKKHGSSQVFTMMIAQDYSVWIKAQLRFLELYPNLKNSSVQIKSKY